MDPFGEIREEKALGESQLQSEPLLGPSQPSAQSTLDDLLGGSTTTASGHADDLLGEFLSATAAPSEAMNRAATEPILPPLEAEHHEEAQPERIQFESGIDLSDIMSKKTDMEEQHIPKAKEHLEDVYAAASTRQPIKEEPKEEEMDFRPLPPEPEGNESNEEEEEDEMSQEQPPPAVRQPEPIFAEPSAPATNPTRAVDDEIAACDLSGLCKYFVTQSNQSIVSSPTLHFSDVYRFMRQ